MKDFIESIKTQVGTVPGINFVDENTGQLDDYSPNFPVKWPCVLIDVVDVVYSNMGRNEYRDTENRQRADVMLELRVANLKLTNSSGRAPIAQRNSANSIQDLIDVLHEKIQGFRPVGNSSKLIRSRRQRIKRDDGVQEYVIYYTSGITDV